MELAFRLIIADLSLMLGVSFQSCYKAYCMAADDVGWAWIFLTTVCLEDKTFGQGLFGSIMAHPILTKIPALQDLGNARTDEEVVQVARRFQAAFDTMTSFDSRKPRNQGTSSFNRHLRLIDEPEDLWVVLAGLKRLVVTH